MEEESLAKSTSEPDDIEPTGSTSQPARASRGRSRIDLGALLSAIGEAGQVPDPDPELADYTRLFTDAHGNGVSTDGLLPGVRPSDLNIEQIFRE